MKHEPQRFWNLQYGDTLKIGDHTTVTIGEYVQGQFKKDTDLMLSITSNQLILRKNHFIEDTKAEMNMAEQFARRVKKTETKELGFKRGRSFVIVGADGKALCSVQLSDIHNCGFFLEGPEAQNTTLEINDASPEIRVINSAGTDEKKYKPNDSEIVIEP